MRHEPDWIGRTGMGDRGVRQVDHLAPSLVPVADEGEPFAASSGIRDQDAGPGGDVAPRRGPERAEVRANEISQPLLLGRIAWADPILGEPEPVSAPARPR